MRLFPADWGIFLDELALWSEISIPARRAFLSGCAPGLVIEAARGDASDDELLDSGFLAVADRPGYRGIPEEHAQFHHVLKSLERCPLFELPGLAALCSYLAEHYTSQERSQLHESMALLPNDLPRVAGFVSSVEWLQGAFSRAPRDADAAEGAAARAMLAFFTEQRDRIPLRDLEEYFPGIRREDLCAGMRYGVQRAVFFLGLRRTDLEPLIGVWPAAARRLRRLSVVLAPEPVSVTDAFHHPFLVEDMTSLLMCALVEPIPLRRGDDKPFARFVESAGDTLLTLPDWLEGVTELSLEGRIGLALQALRIVGLLVSADATGGAAPLAPGPQALQWLRKPLAPRRDAVLHALAGGAGHASRVWSLLDEELTSAGDAQEEVRPWLEQAFSFVPVTTYIRFSDFAEYQAAIGSPLATASLPAAGMPRSSAEPGQVAPGLATEEALEELWKSFLGIFLGRCLLSLGGAEAGLDPEGRPAFRMTDVGRALIGLPRDGLPESPEPVTRLPELIVQPNYEVVFLTRSPAAEAELGRFCERIGREVGVLFRITRASLARARAAGLDAAMVRAALTRGSRGPLPSNVEHEIEGWMSLESESGAT